MVKTCTHQPSELLIRSFSTSHWFETRNKYMLKEMKSSLWVLRLTTESQYCRMNINNLRSIPMMYIRYNAFISANRLSEPWCRRRVNHFASFRWIRMHIWKQHDFVMISLLLLFIDLFEHRHFGTKRHRLHMRNLPTFETIRNLFYVEKRLPVFTVALVLESTMV